MLMAGLSVTDTTVSSDSFLIEEPGEPLCTSTSFAKMLSDAGTSLRRGLPSRSMAQSRSNSFEVEKLESEMKTK